MTLSTCGSLYYQHNLPRVLIILQFCVKEAIVHVFHNRALNSLRADSLGWGAATRAGEKNGARKSFPGLILLAGFGTQTSEP